MSFTRPRNTTGKNPATKFIKWSGSIKKGYFSYYDKEKKEDIVVDLSKGFFILDQDLFSITGYNEPKKMQIQSNEVRTTKDKLTVNGWKDGQKTVLMQGSYEELKERIQESVIYKYTRCVYALLDGELVHIQLTGSAVYELGQAFKLAGNPHDRWCIHSKTIGKTKGEVSFRYPEFAIGEKINQSIFEIATEQDTILQEYLDRYLVGGLNKDTDNYNQEEASQEPSSFDSKNWRQFKSASGVKLCDLSIEKIQDIQDHLIENNDVDGDYYACVGQALYEYQKAQKTWESKKDRSGKYLKDYTLDEMKSMLDKINSQDPCHEMKLILEAAIDAMAQVENFDDDDIPF